MSHRIKFWLSVSWNQTLKRSIFLYRETTGTLLPSCSSPTAFTDTSLRSIINPYAAACSSGLSNCSFQCYLACQTQYLTKKEQLWRIFVNASRVHIKPQKQPKYRKCKAGKKRREKKREQHSRGLGLFLALAFTTSDPYMQASSFYYVPKHL